MIKSKGFYGICILVLIFLVNKDMSCNEVNSGNIQRDVNLLDGLLKNTYTEQEKQEEEIRFQEIKIEYIDLVNELTNLYMFVENETLSYDTRIEYNNEYIEKLDDFFSINETLDISDYSLQILFKEHNLNFTSSIFEGCKTRLIEYNAPYNLFGTIDGGWVMLQYDDGDKNFLVTLVASSRQSISSYRIYVYEGNIRLLMTGYTYMYSPRPIYIEVWQLENNIWEKIDLQMGCETDKQISINENFVLVENYIEQNYVEMQKSQTGVLIYGADSDNVGYGIVIDGNNVNIVEN